MSTEKSFGYSQFSEFSKEDLAFIKGIGDPEQCRLRCLQEMPDQKTAQIRFRILNEEKLINDYIDHGISFKDFKKSSTKLFENDSKAMITGNVLRLANQLRVSIINRFLDGEFDREKKGSLLSGLGNEGQFTLTDLLIINS